MQESAKKTMQKRDAKQRIILTLGREGGPLKPHAIAKRTGLSDAGVQTAIKGHRGLVLAGMLRPFHEPEPWKAGGKTVEYVLTFRGVIEYLNLIEELKPAIPIEEVMKEGWAIEDRHDADEEIRKFIQKYSEFYDYVPFKEHRALKEWLGDRAYGFFATTARKLKWSLFLHIVTASRQELLEGEMSMALDELNEKESALNKVRGKRKETTLDEQIAALESERDKLERWIHTIIDDTEKLWMHAFSLMLFELIYLDAKGKIKRVENELLHRHIKETFERERKECAVRVRDIREMKATFEKVFSLRPKIVRRPAVNDNTTPKKLILRPKPARRRGGI